ncbi:hypothetical protein HOH11_01120 [Candidatus Woesearchaeota archaeon]|jgi:uncharacterized protein|nr:hypothetical protein [Candidatus Woesearchaeota archaeon]MBT6023188.1 hypothetical protein [Candidatus Woesearchaeota archaeon]
MTSLNEAIELIDEICEEHGMPRNVKEVLNEVKTILQDNSRDVQIILDTAKQKISDLSEDPNLQTFSRTQIWNLASALEEV